MDRKMPTIIPLPITAFSTITNCGVGNEALYRGLLSGQTALKKPALLSVDFPAYTGEVDAHLLPTIDPALQSYETRNARIALAALNHSPDQLRETINNAVQRYTARRIGIVLGTSTSGIYETENAYIALQNQARVPRQYHFAQQHAWAATAQYLQRELKLAGPCYVISTACSSSSKSIAAAQRLIAADVCDAVLAGGVDSLCRMTLHGFNSLGLVSETACTPLDKDRAGISLGEGAGLVLIERPAKEHKNCLHLLGSGESSDAHHMTAPHPKGKGAILAMQKALAQAGLQAEQIDYLNLHATGTPKNDQAEMIAVEKVFGENIYCSGSKGLTGHTLGAAGGVEAVVTLLALQQGFRPGTCGLKQVDSSFNSHVLHESEPVVNLKIAMSNNYGFGGNNASLIFGRPYE
jgi:3-oxoacyl-[acyl-carrier-protein] synthase-1